MSPRRPLSLALVALAAALAATPAVALRCPGGLVDVGDHKVTVLDRCGEPLTKDRVLENPTRVVGTGESRVVQILGVAQVTDEWVYEFSPQRFRQLLRFRGNRLLEVEALRKPD